MDNGYSRKNGWKRLAPGLLGVALLAGAPGGGAVAAEVCPGTPADDPAVAAFLQSEAVAKAAAEQTAAGNKPGCIFAVAIGSSCGVAGCGTSYLVGQGFTSTGANPQTSSVLAQTEIMRPTGKARPARRVRIVPY